MATTHPGKFKPIKKRRLSDEVAAQIRSRIAAGELRPGDRLPPERFLADDFEISRGAVREAMRSLELAGIVTVQQGVNGGAFISNGDPSLVGDNFRDLIHLGGVTLDELTESRIWIETLAARIAAERATEDDLRALEDNVAEVESLYAAGRYDEKIDVNLEFHALLARATHNTVMVLLMSALVEVLRGFAYEAGPESDDMSIRARRAFLKRLRARDSEGAAASMEQHLRKLHKRYASVAERRSAEPRA